MRPLLSIALTALALTCAASSTSLPPALSSTLAVALAVALAAVAGGGLTPTSVIAGALGALAQAALVDLSPVAAGAALLACAATARARLASGGLRGLLAQLGLALLGGAAASWLVLRWTLPTDGVEVGAVAVIVGALLSSAHWLLPADDLLAARLEELAARNQGTTRWRLERAAELRREMSRGELQVPRSEARRILRAFRALLRLGDTRLRARSAEADALDEAIAEHLSAVEKSFRVIRSRTVAVEGSRREAAEDLREGSLSLEAEAEAYAESSAIGRE